jgi:putative transposase
MRHPHCSPRAAARQPAWAAWLAGAAGLTDAAVPAGLLARCLLLAAACGVSLAAAARRLGAGREAVRRARAAQPGPDDARLARAVRASLPRRWRRPARVALDVHRRPYYGDRRRTPGVTGGRAERGTRWAFGYATAVVVRRGRRYTAGLTPVGPADRPEHLVERLLAQLAWAGVPVRCVLLDRGFYAAGVVAALRRRGLRFVIPVIRRGRGPTGTARFFRRGTRGWFAHAWRARGKSGPAVGVAVGCQPGPGGRPWVFACSDDRWPAAGLVGLYRRRFGAEASYRQLGECLARTTARDAGYRLLLVAVAVLVRNLWVRLGGGAGGPPLAEVREAIRAAVTDAPTTPAPPPSSG